MNKKVILILLSTAIILSSIYIGADNQLLTENYSLTLIGKLRFSRTIAAFLAGFAFSIAGAVTQSIFQTPLASPYTLGIAGLAISAISIVTIFSTGVLFISEDTTLLWIPFVGVISAMLGVFCMFFMKQRNLSKDSFVILGLSLSFFSSSILMLVQYITDISGVFRLTRWLLGNIRAVSFTELFIQSVFTAASFFIALKLSKQLDILKCGDQFANFKGVSIKKTWLASGTAIAFATGVTVSLFGPVPFIGIFEPILARKLFGEMTKDYILPAGLIGGIFLVMCDLIARTLLFPLEIPTGVVTSILGLPVVIYLVVRKS